MKKNLNKIILFSKGLMPTSKKFYQSLETKLGMTIEETSDSQIPKIMINDVLINDLNNFSLKNKDYFINVSENRLELGMVNLVENTNLTKFEEIFTTIIEELSNIYIELIRVGYIYTYFDSDSSIEELNIPFLKNSQELNIQYNKKVNYLSKEFNNNITISNHYNLEYGLLIVQDFNFVIKNEVILELDIIKTIFNHLKNEYYTENFKNKILGV